MSLKVGDRVRYTGAFSKASDDFIPNEEMIGQIGTVTSDPRENWAGEHVYVKWDSGETHATWPFVRNLELVEEVMRGQEVEVNFRSKVLDYYRGDSKTTYYLENSLSISLWNEDADKYVTVLENFKQGDVVEDANGVVYQRTCPSPGSLMWKDFNGNLILNGTPARPLKILRSAK